MDVGQDDKIFGGKNNTFSSVTRASRDKDDNLKFDKCQQLNVMQQNQGPKF